MANILRGEPARVDVFTIFSPEREDAFVTCLLAEMRTFLFYEDADTRRNAFRTCDILLRQRQGIMKELLMPEVRDRKTKERRVLDIYTKGFMLLQEPQAASVRAIGEDDAMANVKFRRFEYWLDNDESEDVQQVFRTIQDRASAILGDEQLPTPEVIERLKDLKVQSLPPPNSSPRSSGGETVAKAYETFITFYQHIIRTGLGDLSYGSVHWKKTLNSLRGVGSIWEGNDLEDEKQDAWGAMMVPEPVTLGGTRGSGEVLRWKLDMTEGPERMRRRLKRNYEFADVYQVMQRPEFRGLITPTGSATALLESESLSVSSPSTTVESSEAEKDKLGEDFRATAKLIKQVALVRRSSQRIGIKEEEVRESICSFYLYFAS